MKSPEAAMTNLANGRARLRAAVKDIGPQSAVMPERPWYGRRASEHALPLTDLGCRTLGVHLTATTIKDRA